MLIHAVSMTGVFVAALLCPSIAVVPDSSNPANDLETFPRLKGTNQGSYNDFIRMLASTGSQGQVVGKVPIGSDPTKIAAALQQRATVDEGKVCHIDVLVPQKVSGRCIALESTPTCMAKDRMETNYRDCVGLTM